MITQLPGGILAERFGGKYVFGLGVLLTGLCNLFTPLAARSGVSALLAVRLITGLAEVSITNPEINHRSIVKEQRSRTGCHSTGDAQSTVEVDPADGAINDGLLRHGRFVYC